MSLAKIPAILVDLDGTLANVNERRKDFLVKKDWDSFYSRIEEDLLNVWCKEIIDKFKTEYRIIILTGRNETYRSQTMNWLSVNDVFFNDIYFRSSNDFRQDDLVKKELYEKFVGNKYKVLFVVDDRASVVKMWRSLGLICLQCDEGNF